MSRYKPIETIRDPAGYSVDVYAAGIHRWVEVFVTSARSGASVFVAMGCQEWNTPVAHDPKWSLVSWRYLHHKTSPPELTEEINAAIDKARKTTYLDTVELERQQK